ncbi:MAG: DUF6263 family protein [Prevotellaceae bacterium]|jgi:hypothetical protein|nr:DUF6263 family protein [Prevotellaceae bacterium]
MKNLITKISLLGLMFIFVFACGVSGKGEKYKFEFNFEKGSTFKQKTLTESKSSQELMGQKMESTIAMTADMSFDVKDFENNLYKVDMKYDAVKMDMLIAGMSLSFDSNTTEDKAYGQNMSPIFKAMVNIPFEVEMNKKGKVFSVTGFENITAAMLDAMSELDENTTNQMLQQIGNSYSEESIKSTLEQSFAYFPENEVAAGDTWKKDMDINIMNTTINVTMNITLEKVVDNIASLKAEGTIKTVKDIIQDLNGIEAKTSLSGNQTINLQIDLKTCWIVSGEIRQSLVGETNAMGMKIPITTVNTTTIKGEQ